MRLSESDEYLMEALWEERGFPLTEILHYPNRNCKKSTVIGSLKENSTKLALLNGMLGVASQDPTELQKT